MAIYMMRAEPSTVIAHYPLTSSSTTNDTSGNGYNLTNNWNTVFGTYHWVSCAYFNGNNSDLTHSNFYNLAQWDYTVNVWAYKLAQANSNYDYYVYAIWSMGDATDAWKASILEYDDQRLRFALWFDDCDAVTNPQWEWVNICLKYTKSDWWQYIYVNWQLSNSRTTTNTHILEVLNMYIGHNPSHWNFYWNGYLSELIFDWKAWTAQEVLDYYNDTKSNYWL